jgi:hypothetical protein
MGGCRVWVIPENGETIRTDDVLRVWRTDDGGETWIPSVNGLPNGKHTVLREGMATDVLNPAGVHFGTTAGTLFASTDGGAHRSPIAEGLRRIQSVEVSVVGQGSRPASPDLQHFQHLPTTTPKSRTKKAPLPGHGERDWDEGR